MIHKRRVVHPQIEYHYDEEDSEYSVIFVASPLDELATFKAVIEYESALMLNVMKEAGEPSRL